MKKQLLLIVLFLPLLLSAANKPNVIVVLADDIGVGDISHYRRMHSDNIILETPNIDSLANGGMVFTNAHSPAALCSPSRYGIMTGNNCYRSFALWGVWGSYQLSSVLDSDLTLGRLMQRAGYTTSFFGKWNLGGDFYRLSNPTQIYRAPRVQPELDVDVTKMINGPQQKGFDYNFTFPSGIQDVPYVVLENNEWVPLKDDSEIAHITQDKMDLIGVTLDKDEGLGDSNWDPHDMGPLLVNKAVDYINANANQEKPFFMYYCALAVHLPHTPCTTLNGIDIAGTTPSDHMDMIKELDVQMGMLVDALKAQGVYENTLFIFTSDNGGLSNGATNNSGHRPSDIYRGSKNLEFEGGHRVPFIVNWPEKISSGKISKAPILNLDIAATLASITETEIVAGQAMDSYNLWPILRNDPAAENPTFLLLQSGTGKKLIIIEDGWKLIIQTDAGGSLRTPDALFDLNSNIGEDEGQNLINNAAYMDRIDAMLAKYNQIRNSKVPTNILRVGPDSAFVADPSLKEEIKFISHSAEFPQSTKQFEINIHYLAKEVRDISLDLLTPAPENKSVKNIQITVPAGIFDTTIVLTLSKTIDAGDNYEFALSLRPVGLKEQQNIIQVKSTFNLIGKETNIENQLDESHSIDVFPNPTRGKLSISNIDKIQNVQIINMQGQIQNEIHHKSNSFDISGLETGVYYIKLTTTDNKIAIKRILKN